MKGFAVYPFPVGFLRIDHEDGNVVAVGRVSAPADAGEANTLTERVRTQLSEYFSGKRKTFDFPYALRGTPFQLRVWAALCAIPYGETRTYKEIAETIGSPKACRAVGMANHRNPIVIAVPCHRVIGAGGALVGYGCGLDMKSALLALEAKGSSTAK